MHNDFTQSMSKFYNTVKHFHDLTYYKINDNFTNS